jgi:hypothetical protein
MLGGIRVGYEAPMQQHGTRRAGFRDEMRSGRGLSGHIADLAPVENIDILAAVLAPDSHRSIVGRYSRFA